MPATPPLPSANGTTVCNTLIIRMDGVLTSFMDSAPDIGGITSTLILPQAEGKQRFLRLPPQLYKVPATKEETRQAIMTRMHKTRIGSLLAIGLLTAILAQQTSMAQSPPPPEGAVNSPGSVLYGRTIEVANKILDELGPSIAQYNQVTNLAQLSGITSLNLAGAGITFLRAGDFEGFTNLQTLIFRYSGLTSCLRGYLTSWSTCKR